MQYGDIGRVVSAEATYFCGPTWGEQAKWLKDHRDPEMRLRAWGLDRALSGDVITEQNIHALDVASWVLDAVPLAAVGTGGQRARTAGTCWDTFAVIFSFPQDVVVSFASKQLGDGWDDICCRVYGTEGTLDTHYFADVSIRGKLPYRGGKIPNLYTDGRGREHRDLPRVDDAGRPLQPDRAGQRAQQPDHHPRPVRRVEGRPRHVGRDDVGRGAARGRPAGPAELTPCAGSSP
ncbi:MAG: Gfo/Idh/MocA family oxidoreductase [Vicinamibacteria bacterium]